MKKILVCILLIATLCGTLLFASCDKGEYNYTSLDPQARFLTNYAGQTVTLASGRTAITDGTVFAVQDLKIGETVTEPETTPTRTGYNFTEWTLDKEGTLAYDFSLPVEGSLNLYAQWARIDGEAEVVVDHADPVIAFRGATIDESAPFSLVQICGAFVSQGAVDLTTAGIKRLEKNAANVKELLTYKHSSATTVVSAVYADSAVTVTYAVNGAAQTPVVVAVNDVTASHVVENQYEVKALKYEDNYYIENYKVVLAGSSSMENWRTSAEDMGSIKTINVGIGGTTAGQWAEHLADRLIIPYNPRAVVLYVGINDIINSHRTAEQAVTDLTALFEKIHTHLPDTAVQFILINHVPGYYSVEGGNPAKVFDWSDEIDETNDAIVAYAASHDYLSVIDAGSCLTKENGSYSKAYFVKDGLHMSLLGYTLWGAEVKKAVIAKDEEIYG